MRAAPALRLLEDFLGPLERSQYRLAKGLGVPPRRINEIVLGKSVREDIGGVGLSQ